MIDYDGRTALHVLLEESSGDDVLPIARLLAEAHPESVTMLDSGGRTPLHRACKAAKVDDLPLVRFLVELYPAALYLNDSDGDTPLGLACKRGVPFTESKEIIWYLVQGCPHVLEPDDDSGTKTPLHELCKRDSKRPVELGLLEMLAISEKAVKAQDELGRTSLHWLSYYGKVTPESLQILIEKCPGLPSVTDKHGRLPLHLTIKRSAKSKTLANTARYHHTLQCLLKAFPDGIYAKDNDGKTPLELACKMDVDLTLIFELVQVNPIATLCLERGRQA